MDNAQPSQTEDATVDTPNPSPARSRLRLTPLTVVAILAPGIVIFALPAVRLIARNEEFFGGDLTVGRTLFSFALISTVIGLALWTISASKVGRFLLICYALLTPGWVLYSMLLDWRRAVGALIVAALVLAGAYLITRSQRPRIAGIGLFSALFLVGMVGTTMIASGATDQDAGSGRSLASTEAPPMSTSLPNVYHIVFDEFQTEMFEMTLDSTVQEALAGFVYYPDARTPYGRTEMSMASIFGPADYGYDVTPQEFVDSSLRGAESSFELLRRTGYHITGYIQVESLYGPPQPFDQTLLFRDFVESNPGSNYAKLATSVWVYYNLPGSIAKRLISRDDYEQLSGQNLLPSDSPALSHDAFRTFINRERQRSATGRYSLVHLILPHFPYVLSADCEYEVGLETTPTAQALCATSLMVDFLEDLHSLGRFEDSTVIIQSDHGARLELSEEGQLRRVASEAFGEQWNGARSRSLLLVKPAGADSSGELIVSDYPALLTDVMPTIFDSLGVSFEVSEGRTSLLSDTLPVRDVRHYHFYDKGPDGLPDGEVVRFEIIDGVVSGGETIRLPNP